MASGQAGPATSVTKHVKQHVCVWDAHECNQRYTRQLIWERLLLLRAVAGGQAGARTCNLCNKTFRIEHA